MNPISPLATTTLLDHWLTAVVPDEHHKLNRRLQWDSLDPAAFECWLAADIFNPDQPGADGCDSLEIIRAALQKHRQLALLPYQSDCQRPFQDIWWPVRI